jgi:hypothetical protein
VVKGVGQIDGSTDVEWGWKDRRLNKGRGVLWLDDGPTRLTG